MKGSLLVGRFLGTDIRLHASLLLLIPYALFSFQPQSLGGALRVLLLIAAIFFCVALHEMGHTLAARAFGIQVNSIVLWPLGGFANLSRRPEKVLHDLTISAAGPLANLLLFVLLAAATLTIWLAENTRAFPPLSEFLGAAQVFTFFAGLTIANLSLAVFNLIPIYPLDGGQIARGVLKLLFGDKHADLILLVISLPLALGLTLLGFILSDFVLVLTGGILLLAGATLSPYLLNGLTLLVTFFVDRGGYYLKRLEFDRAVETYTHAIRSRPNQAGLYVSRAIAFMHRMDLKQAQADIDQALRLDPASAVAWMMRGELLSLENQNGQALAAYDTAIAHKPNWSIAYMDRGWLHMEQGRLDKALEDMNRGVDLGQGSAVNYVLRSILRYEMGDRAGARADSEQALRYAPGWMLNFSEIFLENFKGHLNWALDYYWRAIERTPKAYQAYLGRADACRINGRYDWAISDYHRAIQLAPQRSGPYLGRGLAYQQLGYNEYAANDFRQAIALAEKSHVKRRAEELLAAHEVRYSQGVHPVLPTQAQPPVSQ